MKRSDLYIRVITLVLFLAVASYIGVSIYNAAINTYVTAPAISYSIEETLTADGYIIRSETVLTDNGPAVLPIVDEGAKIASGQAVAVEYLNSKALETASELRGLRLKIAQLETSGALAEALKLDTVIDLSAAVQNGDLKRLDELSLMIDTYIFSGGSTAGDELPGLKARLETLEKQAAGVRTIYAPVSGTFSHVVDGYEHIEPNALSDITPSMLSELFRLSSGAYGVGKLVTEFKWYYAAVMESEDVVFLSEGRRFPVQFSGAYNAKLDMLVEKIGKREDGRCVVSFSSNRSIHEFAALRHLNAEVVLDVITGILVPKDAIHLDDDGAIFVFLETGVRAERVDVEILKEFGDSYLVRDGIETGSSLRAGSTIIVKANKLFDGKVVV